MYLSILILTISRICMLKGAVRLGEYGGTMIAFGNVKVPSRTLNNFFVDCSDWHYYFKDFDVRFPITYCIAGWLMRKVIFASADEMRNALHIESIGCLMDFCEEKKQIALKQKIIKDNENNTKKRLKKNVLKKALAMAHQCPYLHTGVQEELAAAKKWAESAVCCIICNAQPYKATQAPLQPLPSSFR